MDYDEIKRISGKTKIPMAVIEKDYILTILLTNLAQISGADKLFFKGGTAIKKMYYSDARFSVDLDFTAV